MKVRLITLVCSIVALNACLAGCGGGDSSGSRVAELAPAGAPLFVEGVVRPDGELKSNADAIAMRVAGIDSLGGFVISALESAAGDEGAQIDFGSEVEPWLGEHAGLFFERIDGADPSERGVIVESTDPGATREFVAGQVRAAADPYRSATYGGIAYKVGGSEGSAVGVVGEFLVVAEDAQIFKQVVDASRGESLATEAGFARTIDAASDAGIADVYVDLGELVDQAGEAISPLVLPILRNTGIDLSGATAVASVIPTSEQVEIELSGDLAGEEAPAGDVSKELGELPSNAVLAVGVSDFGTTLTEAIESLDAEGIPGAVEAGRLKALLGEFGFGSGELSGSVRDAVVYLLGSVKGFLSGAVVMTTNDQQAIDAVAGLGPLLRKAGVRGVGIFDGAFSGVYYRNRDVVGSKPAVAVTKDGRISIGYGYPAVVNPLYIEPDKGKLLREKPSFEAAVAALGDTPINGFVDGEDANSLLDSLIPASNREFAAAKRYLNQITFLALGTTSQDELATAKLIVGFE